MSTDFEFEPAPPPNAFAIVVGIGSYRDESVPALRHANADAAAICNLLCDPGRLGLPRENVRLLLDGDATLYAMKDALSGWLFKHTDQDTTVFLFFAGHGDLESDKHGREKDGIAKYLLPFDAVPDNLFASALSTEDLRGMIRALPARRVVVFLDACYAGGVAEAGARAGKLKTNPYEQLAEGEGRVVIAAAKPNQRSFENAEVGHGLFTYHLLEALQGKADTDNDGNVTIEEVYAYLQRMVPKDAARLANSVQEPVLMGSMTKDIVLTVDTARQRQQRDAERQRIAAAEQQLRQRRERLVKLYNDNTLPKDAYPEAVHILDADPATLSKFQDVLKDLLIELLDERIQPALYLKQRSALVERSKMSGSGYHQRTSGAEPAAANEAKEQAAAAAREAAAREAAAREAAAREAAAREAAAREAGAREAAARIRPRFCRLCGRPLAPAIAFCQGCGQRV